MTKSISYLLESLEGKEEAELGNRSEEEFLGSYNKDIIILDYLITCKQLLEMIEKEVKMNGS